MSGFEILWPEIQRIERERAEWLREATKEFTQGLAERFAEWNAQIDSEPPK